MSQTNVYVKEFANKEEAMQYKRDTTAAVIYHYNNERYIVTHIDEYLNGEQLPLETLDTSLMYVDDTNPLACKLYRYMRAPELGEEEAPIEHDYVKGLTTGLFPRRTFVQGELQRVEWFSDEAMTDLVIDVNVAYVRDFLGFALSRTTTRDWIREDGTKHPYAKIKKKLYDDLAQIEEGQRRRGNLVKGLSKPVLGLMIQTMAVTNPELSQPEIVQLGRDFIKAHKLEFQSFVDDSHPQILTDITTATDAWLDNDIGGLTIRDFILAELNIY